MKKKMEGQIKKQNNLWKTKSLKISYGIIKYNKLKGQNLKGGFNLTL